MSTSNNHKPDFGLFEASLPGITKARKKISARAASLLDELKSLTSTQASGLSRELSEALRVFETKEPAPVNIYTANIDTDIPDLLTKIKQQAREIHQNTLTLAGLIRQARLAVSGNPPLGQTSEPFDSLQPQDLDPEERACLVPVFLLVGDSGPGSTDYRETAALCMRLLILGLPASVTLIRVSTLDPEMPPLPLATWTTLPGLLVIAETGDLPAASREQWESLRAAADPGYVDVLTSTNLPLLQAARNNQIWSPTESDKRDSPATALPDTPSIKDPASSLKKEQVTAGSQNLVTLTQEEISQREDQAVARAMERLVRKLAGSDSSTVVLAAPSDVSTVPGHSSLEANQPVAATSAGPWIDTELCTACGECININSKIFVYNDNKKAIIQNATAGPFRDIVKAAEKCAAGIIHPGEPANPGEKDLEKWKKRAARFQ